MTNTIQKKVIYYLIDESSEGQKIDNFLIKLLKAVPKSHIYKILRSGQVRVNKKRVNTAFRLSINDNVRVPPVEFKVKERKRITPNKQLEGIISNNIIYEDDLILAINKPAGYAVHGGSGISFGIIELVRSVRPNDRFLELIHRIDKETSGVLMIAKKRSALVSIHKQMRQKSMHKKYQVIVIGLWKDKQKIVNLDLLKTKTIDGQNKVKVLSSKKNNTLSKQSKSVFFLNKNFGDYSLLDVKLVTGRTHQIRVHLAHLGFPVVGDQKYGNFNLNKTLSKTGFKRMCLHANEYSFIHPFTEKKIFLEAPFPSELNEFIIKNE